MSRRGGSRSGVARRLEFSRRELRDLGAAWLTMGLAFALFFAGGTVALTRPIRLAELLVISILTAGVGFLVHELAHKVTAVRFGQVATFQANYPMLVIGIAAALAGIIFVAPGAVYHRGRVTKREKGLVAIAGPVSNLVLAGLSVPLVLVPVSMLSQIGTYGVLINLFLAAFNLLPFGPLDGRKVLSWHRLIFIGTLGLSIGLLLLAILAFFS